MAKLLPIAIVQHSIVMYFIFQNCDAVSSINNDFYMWTVKVHAALWGVSNN